MLGGYFILLHPVCLSHTGTVSKRLKLRMTQTVPHDSHWSLVFWHQRLWQNSNGVNPNKDTNCRWPRGVCGRGV